MQETSHKEVFPDLLALSQHTRNHFSEQNFQLSFLGEVSAAGVSQPGFPRYFIGGACLPYIWIGASKSVVAVRPTCCTQLLLTPPPIEVMACGCNCKIEERILYVGYLTDDINSFIQR